MILLAGRSTQLKLNKRLIFPSILFKDNQWEKAVFEKCKNFLHFPAERAKAHSRERKFACGPPNTVSNFFKSSLIVKQVVLLFSGINVQWPKVHFQSGLWKSELQRF